MERNLEFAYYDMGSAIDEYVHLRCNKDGVPEPIIHSGRRSGNSTRLADHYIQVLFNTGKVKVIDHTDLGDKYLLDVIVQRLQREHRMNNKNFQVKGYEITLI